MLTISSQITPNNINTISFTAKRRRRCTGGASLDPVDSFKRTKQRNYKKKNSSIIRTRIAAMLSAAAVAISGVGGYSIGKNQSDKEAYITGYNDGKQQAYIDIQAQEEAAMTRNNLVDIEELGTNLVDIEELGTNLVDIEEYTQQEEIPEKVYSLAPDTIVELDLTEKPYLFKDESNLPAYFGENNIDLDVLKLAQFNCARVFRSGNYLIISPKQDVTLGEVKRVFGIIDEVIGKEPLNEAQTRPHAPGSNGNLDNAIVEANDAIRIKIYDNEKGHQIGVYAAHKSNKSRQKIADEILIWANK